jgi:hypothetical protein
MHFTMHQVSARIAASGLTIWASPARLKILIKKLRRSLLSVGGGLSLSGAFHITGDGAPVKM